MNPFQINPHDLAKEIYDFGSKLAGGFDTLADIGELEEGVSARDSVYQEDKMTLYHYRPRTEKQNPIPLLIVYALVNRPIWPICKKDAQ